MHHKFDQYRDCQGKNVGSREEDVEPFRLDADNDIEGASEYQDGSCNRQGWRNLRVYG